MGSLILAVTTAQKNGGQLPPPPPPGLCLDPKMMSAVCTINTEIGSRMEQAHLQCAAAAQVQERKKKKNNKKNKGKKGKGKKCDVDILKVDFRRPSWPVFGLPPRYITLCDLLAAF